MFAQHQPTIAAFGQRSPANMSRVINFVLLTIRQPLFNIPVDLETLDNGGDEAEALMFGPKRNGWHYMAKHADMIYEEAIRTYDRTDGADCADQLLEIFARIPGLGLVKAGFAVQLIFGLSGCIDTHNIKRFGLSPRSFRADHYKARTTLKSRLAKCREYNATVDKLGGTQSLWDSWCHFVADKQPSHYHDAIAVSAIHLSLLSVTVH